MSEQAKKTNQLVTVDELYGEVEVASKHNELNKLLNLRPKAEWLKHHPLVKIKKDNVEIPLPYMPIERVEYLLTSIFIRWRVEVKNVQVIANSVVVTVRLWYRDPITGEWDWQEGVGAAPIQTDKGASATDFSKVKSSAVQMAAPAAKSFAIKDAAECLGKIFGKDLTRPDEISYLESLNSKFNEPLNK
jgi:hypothetical protein